ncbi:MAG: ubiquinol-cytochrome C chaperone [Methyloceanibacter sp.]|nr:ubiquinol-cytochrome C chaperone [Methyloceanibacter sp.]
MGRSLNPLSSLSLWRRDDTSATKLYGAIVAQARLPVFYQGFGVPDTLEGRFLMLSLHLFATLHRLKAEGPKPGEPKPGEPKALDLAQDLIDRFGADMETVLREIGVGDLSIPKKVRGLAASGASLLQSYEEALAEGDEALAAAIAHALQLEDGASGAAGRRLAHYLKGVVDLLQAQDFAALSAGEMRFPGAIPGEEPGDDFA